MITLEPAARRLMFFALILCAAGPVAAQVSPGVQTVQRIPDANDPVERLSRYVRTLAAAPRDLSSLLGAGQAALDVGDPNAALGFFARAEEVAPSSGAVKAGLGSSLVMIERPDDALRLFAEAVSLGVPEAAIARDRGLAYDLRGDSRRAQADYRLALTRGNDDELIRRHALSLAIGGDRAGAMTMLDPLLRKQDQGAWRARAFVLAMTGDVSGANGVARQLMVPAMASAMAPLLARLATLNPAERAHAVNFGTVPSDGTQLAVQTGDPYLAAVARAPAPPVRVADAGVGLIPSGEPLGPRPVAAKPQADSAAPRRRPGEQQVATISPDPRPGFDNGFVGPVDPARLPLAARGTAVGATRLPIDGLPNPTVAGSARSDAVTPVPTTTTAPAFDPPKSEPLPAAPVVTPPPANPSAAAAPSPPPAPVSRLAGLLEGLERESETAVDLPSARELRAARDAARKKMAQLAAQTAAEEAAKKEREEKTAAARRHPARLWVQVATGRNDSGLALTWRRIRDANPALKGQTPWSAGFRSTNRILVGPMKSATTARELVNKLAKGGLSANSWSSEAGEEVERIASK